MKLLIGIPTAGNPTKPFLETLGGLELPLAVTSVDRITVSGNFVPAQRELIVRRALSVQADVLAMIDDDMVLPADALAQLLAVLASNERCALVGALYYSRDGLRPMAVSGWDERCTTSARTPAFDDRTPVAVDGVGFGCVLARVNAIATLAPPIFQTQVYVEEAANRVRVCNEDYLLCAKLRRAGWTVVLHPGVRCGHYDRARDTVMPQSWEPLSVTSTDRMTVQHADGTVAMVPFDASAPQQPERHVAAGLDYIFPSNS